VIAPILVAIVATLFLLGGGGKEAPPAPTAPIGGSGGAQNAAALAVLPAEPGLRDPNKRLAGRPAKDPFIQKYTAPVFHKGSAPAPESAGTENGSGSRSETVVESSSESTISGPSPESVPAESGGSSGSTPAPGELRLFTFAADIKVSHTEFGKDGQKKMSAPETRERVLPTTPLPGKKSPALTYLGADPKTAKNALMLVSPEVESLLGDGTCVSGVSTCQLLALEPGTPEVVEYGPNGVRYKIEVLKIYPVTTGHVSAKGR
jgi:hypothetical protein